MKTLATVGCLLLLVCFNAVHITPVQAEEECVQSPADIVISLDSSNSINNIGFGRAINFSVNFARALGLGVYRISYATFSTGFKKYADFNTYSDIEDLVQAIQGTKQLKQNTDTANMFRQVYLSGTFLPSNGRRPEVPSYTLLITDGRPDNEDAAIQASKDYQAVTGSKVICLGIGSVLPETLAKLASRPDLVFYVKSFNAINSVLDLIVRKICQDTRTTEAPPQPIPVITTSTSPPEPPPSPPETPPTTTTTTTQGCVGYEETTTTTTTPDTPPAPVDPEPDTTTPPPETTTPEPTPPTTQTTTLPPVTPCTPSYECLHVIQVIDGSSSIGYLNFQRVKEFINRLTPALKAGQLILSAITYGTHNYTVSTPTTNSDLFKQRIDNMSYRNSSTHTNKGIDNGAYFASLYPECKALLIVTTDGLSTYPDKTSAAAANAKSQGIFIVAISVGRFTDKKELNAIASNGAVYEISNYDALVGLADQIAVKACEVLPPEPTTTVAPTDPPPTPPPTTTTTTTTTTTQAPQPAPEPTTTTEAPPPPPPPSTTTTAAPPTTTTVAPCVPQYPRLRLGFAIDSSGSIAPGLFVQNGLLIEAVVKSLNSPSLSFAACTFGTHARVVSGLTDSSEEFLESLSKATYQNSTTRIDRGLYCVFDAFNEATDDNSAKIIILITDGKASDSQAAFDAAAEIKESGADILAVGVGNDINVKELETITQDDNGVSHVTTVAGYDVLTSVLSALVNPICGNN